MQTFSIAYKRFEQMVSFADDTFFDTYIWQPLKTDKVSIIKTKGI